MSNYSKMLFERLSKPGYASIEGVESARGCEDMAYLLFMIIREQHGERVARRIFAKWGTPPTPKQTQTISNIGLLMRLDLMKPAPNVQRLAAKLAEENKSLPRAKQRGAGSTDRVALEKQIRRVRDLREAHMKKGTWLGPFPDGR